MICRASDWAAEAGLERLREIVERPCPGVTIEVGEQVLDEELAAQALAEEFDVGADDRS